MLFILLSVIQVNANPMISLSDPTGPNSYVLIDPTTSAGMSSWVVDGTNHLEKQWYWFAVGTDSERSIDTIGTPSIIYNAPFEAVTTYTSPLFTFELKFTLTGGSVGSGFSDVGESIVITNTSAAPLVFHLFEYTNFNLNGTAGDDTGTLLNTSTIKQTDGVNALTQGTVGVNSGAPARWEISNYPSLIAKLNDGVPTTLANATSGISGNIEFAFQWDLNIGAGLSQSISKDKLLENVVPEPTGLLSMAMSLLGALTIWRRRR